MYNPAVVFFITDFIGQAKKREIIVNAVSKL